MHVHPVARNRRPRVFMGRKIAGSCFGTVPLSFSVSHAARRDIDSDKFSACNRLKHEA
jgi:hypothetical protein